jgi:hypothetical protein
VRRARAHVGLSSNDDDDDDDDNEEEWRRRRRGGGSTGLANNLYSDVIACCTNLYPVIGLWRYGLTHFAVSLFNINTMGETTRQRG